MSPGTQTNNIDSILTENRVFECSDEFRSKAHIRGLDEYERTLQAILDEEKRTDETLTALEEFNVVTVDLATPPLALPTARLVNSACGVCGTDSVQDVIAAAGQSYPVSLDLTTVLDLPGRLREHQPGFGKTGGLHAAGLFEGDGTPVVVREDVGRHNAVDKVVGARILAGEPVPPVLVLSGRIGFELVQKAVVSGVSAIVAVGAPTSLALSLAEDSGVVLVGFNRSQRCVVYAGADRVGV